MSLKEYVTLAVQKSAFEVGDKVKAVRSPYYSVNTGDVVLITKKEFSCSFNIWCYYVNFEKEEDLIFKEDELCSIDNLEYQIEENVQSQIDGILKYTDYSKIQKVMTFLDWTWATRTGLKVPSEFEIKESLRSLLKNLIEDVTSTVKNTGEVPAFYVVSSGGFEVQFIKNSDTDFYISSKFCIDDQDGYWYSSNKE